MWIIILIWVAGACSGLMDLVRFHPERRPDWMKEDGGVGAYKEYWTPRIADEKKNRYWFTRIVFPGWYSGWHLLKEIKISSRS